MARWLCTAAFAALFAQPTAAAAQMKGLGRAEIAGVAHARAIDLRLSQELGSQSLPPLIRTVVLRHQLSGSAAVGVGMSSLYAKRKGPMDMRVGPATSRSRKPAVTFTFKF